MGRKGGREERTGLEEGQRKEGKEAKESGR